MSNSVSLSHKERRLGLCLFPPIVNLDFGCSCGLCRFFGPGALPLLLLSRPLLLPRPRSLLLLVRFFWRTLLLPLLELTVLLARPEALEATEACDLADFWLAREVDLTLVLELDLPDLDVQELCLEVLRVLARSTPGFLSEFGLTLMACPPSRREAIPTLRIGQRNGLASLAACLLLLGV